MGFSSGISDTQKNRQKSVGTEKYTQVATVCLSPSFFVSKEKVLTETSSDRKMKTNMAAIPALFWHSSYFQH